MMSYNNDVFDIHTLAFMVRDRIEWAAEVMGCKKTSVCKILKCGSNMHWVYVVEKMNTWVDGSKKERTISRENYISTINRLDEVRLEYLKNL